MERSIQKNGLINLLACWRRAWRAWRWRGYANSLAGQVDILFLGIGVLVAAVSWFQMRLEDRERLEKLELDELAKTHSGSALFEAKDAEVFPAQRSREQFERFFVPAFHGAPVPAAGRRGLFAVALAVAEHDAAEVKEPITGLALFGVFFPGAIPARPVLRYALRGWNATGCCGPARAICCCNAFLCLVVALGMVGVWAGFPKTDFYVAHVLCGLLGLVALETLIQLVLEIYRPRVKGKIERPLYESRLVGCSGSRRAWSPPRRRRWITSSGSRFPRRGFIASSNGRSGWLVLLQVGALVLSTCVVFIEAGEQGLLEHFGKRVESRSPLGPGAHLKWPWPIDQVYRFRTEQIQTFHVGFAEESGKEQERYVLWSQGHHNETNFLVANRLQVFAGDHQRSHRQADAAGEPADCERPRAVSDHQPGGLGLSQRRRAGAVGGPRHARSGALSGRGGHGRDHVLGPVQEAARNADGPHPGGRRQAPAWARRSSLSAWRICTRR